jgi:hypothetical protein
MKYKLKASLSAAAFLAACASQDDANGAEVANNLLEPIENAASNLAVEANQAAANRTSRSAVPPPSDFAPAPQPAPSNAAATPEAPATKRPSAPPPQPKSEPDPHAGHDMGNHH